jgi:hypothetical protein
MLWGLGFFQIFNIVEVILYQKVSLDFKKTLVIIMEIIHKNITIY